MKKWQNDMVTILLPTYNAEKYIAQCIKSILNQIYRNFELLIIDSSSDDNTVKIIRSFEDSRINLHEIERCPLGRSLNYGLKNAKFDLIARMDADDLMVPERLEVQLSYLKEHPEVDVLSCDVAYFKKRKVLYRLFLPNTDSEISTNLRLHNVINHSGCIYDRRKILEYGGYNELLDVCIDYELWLRVMEKVHFYSLSDVLIFYRISEHSVTRKDKSKTRQTTYDLQLQYENTLQTGFLSPRDYKILMGWREYFYGNKDYSRKYWSHNAISLAVFIAYILTFLPRRFFDFIQNTRFRMRIKYLLTIFGKEGRRIFGRFRLVINL